MPNPSSSSFTGLSMEEVAIARATHGWNESYHKKEAPFWRALKNLVKEPMFLLLLAAAILYFISGQTNEGVFMGFAIILVSTISIYQDARSRHALDALKKLTEPVARVIRAGTEINIPSRELVPGDLFIVEEGGLIPADGKIIQANDCSVNESILTGESFTVSKEVNSPLNLLFQGTFVTGGLAIAEVTAIGQQTKLGQIGKQMASMKEEQTPLQKQIASFVKKMALAGILVFLVVWLIHYLKTRLLLDSLLKALTLAMSILPEEIPVAFTTFMALGAWRLLQMGIIVKQTTTVEALGSASVICTDKTGTLTENKMSLAAVYSGPDKSKDAELIRVAMFASEPIPFDPMEKALHEAYAASVQKDERPVFQMEKEYPLGGKPPMMTHIFRATDGRRVIAAKGAPEAIFAVSNMDKMPLNMAENLVQEFASKGYRVLAVAEADFPENATNYPEQQQQFTFRLLGLVAFYDPPKPEISNVINAFYEAGIKVKILTGDNALTTQAIAREIGFRGSDTVIEGAELMNLTPPELTKQIDKHQVFARMFPEAKLTIIENLKSRNEVVAMTGDGVNDGPALKAAHIGIAMGDKGSELAKKAASLVLTDDDLGKMVDAVGMGRKIYSNLKKAIRYIISIHIPIILTVFLPLALGWIYPSIFTPVHVIFLELIMGPTCSIIYENEPMEAGTMQAPPRPFQATFFSWRELSVSIFQGLVITAACLGMYQYAVGSGSDEDGVRTMVFLTLITANIFLTLVNRSFHYTIFTTIRYPNKLVPIIILITLAITLLLLLIPSFRSFFGFSELDIHYYLVSLLAGSLSVLWMEPVKAYLLLRKKNQVNKS
ncbi:cation-translocating P-type ATPase [Flavihumibacter sp. UBA7668]|uniref:cation-translocating P-type ATPase n=1 Tax=Flavihumibacter sp. UBA7668 TaxID=1946542 RepID=UPI0025BE6963|nr:cation-translocating P-type ATPase [Flavihumibacter sp. UBA7668]